jgi:hypothetical protein
MCFFLQPLSETFIILRRTERDVIKHSYWSSCEVLIILVTVVRLEFYRQIFEKKNRIWNIMKSRPVGTEFFRTDGRSDIDRQTDITKLTVAFRNSSNAPKVIKKWVLANVM